MVVWDFFHQQYVRHSAFCGLFEVFFTTHPFPLAPNYFPKMAGDESCETWMAVSSIPNWLFKSKGWLFGEVRWISENWCCFQEFHDMSPTHRMVFGKKVCQSWIPFAISRCRICRFQFFREVDRKPGQIQLSWYFTNLDFPEIRDFPFPFQNATF